MAMSRPNTLTDFKNKYPEIVGTRIDTCAVCHPYNSNNIQRNLYGNAYLKSLNLTLIESNDSDNDSYTNIEEIRNLTFPGDPNDKPGSLNPNITAASPMTVQTTAAVTPTPAFTTVAKTPGFEMALTVIALLAIFMGFKRIFV